MYFTGRGHQRGRCNNSGYLSPAVRSGWVFNAVSDSVCVCVWVWVWTAEWLVHGWIAIWLFSTFAPFYWKWPNGNLAGHSQWKTVYIFECEWLNGNSNDLCMAELPFDLSHSNSNANGNWGIQNSHVKEVLRILKKWILFETQLIYVSAVADGIFFYCLLIFGRKSATAKKRVCQPWPQKLIENELKVNRKTLPLTESNKEHLKTVSSYLTHEQSAAVSMYYYRPQQ